MAWNVAAALLFRPFYYSRVPQMAVDAAAVVRSKSGMILLNVDMFSGYV